MGVKPKNTRRPKMKHFITSALFSGLLLVSNAQVSIQVSGNLPYQGYPQQSRYNPAATLYLSSGDNSPVSVVIDGTIRSGSGTQLTINFQQAGSHHLSILRTAQNRWGSYPTEVYNGYLNVDPGSVTYATIDAWGNLNLENGNYGYANNQHQCGNHHPRQQPVNSQQARKHGTGYQNYFMNDAAFEQLKQSIRNRSFDSSKETIALQALNSNNLSARQVREILELFTFENTRLKVAKQAFLQSRDRQNFYVVNDAFTFSSSITDLNRFISENS